MTYSAILHELISEVLDEAVEANRKADKGQGAPPGTAYSCDTTAQHADCAAGPDDCSVDQRKVIVMRNETRIENVLDIIREAWEAAPELRLGQLLINILEIKTADELFYLEDRRLVDRFAERTSAAQYTDLCKKRSVRM